MEFEPSFPRGGKEKLKAAAAEQPLKRKQDNDVSFHLCFKNIKK